MRVKEGHALAKVDEMFLKLQENHRTYHPPHRALVLEAARKRGIPVAAHDDRTETEVTRNHEEGITISEFPVSLEAARAARSLGMHIIAGAPNIVRGGSHRECRRHGFDPRRGAECAGLRLRSVGHAGSRLPRGGARAASLPQAVALIMLGPADIVGADRGRIAPGLRADLVQVRLFNGTP